MYTLLQFFKAACIISGIVFILFGCGNDKPILPSDAEIVHRNQDQLTEVIIYDGFTPPVASRIYVYSSLAAYEAIRFRQEGAPSLADKLHGFGTLPEPLAGEVYDFTLAASRAFFTVVHQVRVFSVDSLAAYEESLFQGFREKLEETVYNRSVAFGDSVAGVILARARDDGYLQSRGKTKFLGSQEPGQWRPTPPDYLDGIEWCWNTMKPLVMDSAAQFKPAPPPAYSTDTNSVFYRGVLEVYRIHQNLTPEQRDIARYWDDNPMVIEHSGHLMFANKKITPGGHWMGIAAIASKQSGADPVKAVKAYALTAIALYEGFISCWDEKYRSNYIRPVTVINETLDYAWMPYLQTPPFPEYTSGHSTITAAAAEVLTELFGDNVAFNDTSDLRYIGMQRSFNSFREAAAEVSISRVYGGIHYRFSVDTGMEQGRKLGEFINRRLE
jgi:hypothetical protein